MEKIEEKLIDVEVFNNLSLMLRSNASDDVNLAVETIKNLNPCEEVVRLLLKKTTYRGRTELINMLGQSQWNFNDLTMKEIYNCIKRSEDPNIENIKKIYESLVVEHFQHLTEEYAFIEGKYKIIW
tara:strand:+ start:408 stop:785 length:378 start_codon:yes stop_codon:yes gene_type:complete